MLKRFRPSATYTIIRTRCQISYGLLPCLVLGLDISSPLESSLSPIRRIDVLYIFSLLGGPICICTHIYTSLFGLGIESGWSLILTWYPNRVSILTFSAVGDSSLPNLVDLATHATHTYHPSSLALHTHTCASGLEPTFLCDGHSASPLLLAQPCGPRPHSTPARRPSSWHHSHVIHVGLHAASVLLEGGTEVAHEGVKAAPGLIEPWARVWFSWTLWR